MRLDLPHTANLAPHTVNKITPIIFIITTGRFKEFLEICSKMKKSDITILVADDDPDYLFQTVFNLEKAGYKTVAVESQAEAE